MATLTKIEKNKNRKVYLDLDKVIDAFVAQNPPNLPENKAEHRAITESKITEDQAKMHRVAFAKKYRHYIEPAVLAQELDTDLAHATRVHNDRQTKSVSASSSGALSLRVEQLEEVIAAMQIQMQKMQKLINELAAQQPNEEADHAEELERGYSQDRI